ncbi:MAG: NAD(+) diphosphatase, partial [Xanthomonadales bacterium]|nr:NAD(+) diphosphatase [Xanthomonadales bacterium]
MDAGVSTLQRARRNTFAALDLDRAHERRDDADWLAASAVSASARFLMLDAQSALLVAGDTTSPCCLDAVQRARLLPGIPAHLLGVQDATPWFVLRVDDAAAARVDAALGTRRLRLRDAGLCLDAFFGGLFAYAAGLLQWHANARFCGQCGAPLQLVAGGHRAN